MMTTDRVSFGNAEQLLIGLLERYSPSYDEGTAVAYLVDQMEKLGYRTAIDAAGNAVGEIGNGGDAVLLLGHIDTVPGHIDVRREGRQLYGRGSVDAKGPLACFTVAAANAALRSGKRTVVVGAVEEEAATSKGARYLVAHQPPPSAVIIGEPSGWDRVTVGYKGRLLVDYELARPVGHTAGPAQSVAEDAVAFWLEVARYAERHNLGRDRMFEQLLPSLRSISTDSDGFTERVCATVGFRLPPNLDIAALQQQLVAWGGDATVRFRGREEAYRASRTTPLARAFVRAIGAHGGRARFQLKSGTADMNVVGPAWQCPILAYGPGDALLDHTPNEHLDLDEYQRAICVLTDVLTAY